MSDLKNFKEALVLYGLHSSFVEDMVNNWAIQNRVSPKNCKELV